ncbi:hypothetical protein LXA43DRAFT_1033247 [Ganoderma leucocontextum]|nr:hypothetical protein LXA43DRAFT_1033247 [Ganoderma leucocontextum]
MLDGHAHSKAPRVPHESGSIHRGLNLIHWKHTSFPRSSYIYNPPVSPSTSFSSDSLRTPERRSTLSRPPSIVSRIPPTINYKFWFDDVHVALITSDRIAYRVRSNCLRSASHHLADLITGATKTADKESSFGCPIVHLDIPSARLEPFLDVVTDYMGHEKLSWLAYKRYPGDEGCLSFSSLAAVARTAHQLDACETKFAALSRILHFFKSHAPWLFAGNNDSFQNNWERWSRECGIIVDVENAIEALNLARLLFDSPRFPLALYACCLLSPSQLRNGIARSDGVVEQLSDDDFDKCMRAIPLLHIANHDSLVKTFPAEHWECMRTQRSALPCEGKDGVRKIREAYMAHMKMPGPYRPDLRDLLSPLKFKSLPYQTLFAPGGSSPICGECAERLVGISEMLCSDEASNLELGKYFFPESF